MWVQLKATDNIKTTSDGNAAIVTLDRRDILAWIGDAYPVFLILYDAKSDRGYWLSLRGYFGDKQIFARLHGKTVAVPIPFANLVDEGAMRVFAREKRSVLGR